MAKEEQTKESKTVKGGKPTGRKITPVEPSKQEQ